MQVDESESAAEDSDLELHDSDDERPKKGKGAKVVVDIESEEEEEVIPPPKKRHAATTPARRSMPASLVCNLRVPCSEN